MAFLATTETATKIVSVISQELEDKMFLSCREKEDRCYKIRALAELPAKHNSSFKRKVMKLYESQL